MPVAHTRLRQPATTATGVLMPETAVYENHFPPRANDYIGAAGKVGTMQSESNAERVDKTSHDEFRLRVLLPNTPHSVATLRGS